MTMIGRGWAMCWCTVAPTCCLRTTQPTNQPCVCYVSAMCSIERWHWRRSSSSPSRPIALSPGDQLLGEKDSYDFCCAPFEEFLPSSPNQSILSQWALLVVL